MAKKKKKLSVFKILEVLALVGTAAAAILKLRKKK